MKALLDGTSSTFWVETEKSMAKLHAAFALHDLSAFDQELTLICAAVSTEKKAHPLIIDQGQKSEQLGQAGVKRKRRARNPRALLSAESLPADSQVVEMLETLANKAGPRRGSKQWSQIRSKQSKAICVRMLQESSTAVRLALVNFVHSESVPSELARNTLGILSGDDCAEVRLLAVQALSDGWGRPAADLLFAASDDPDVRVQSAAVTALATMGDIRAIRKLMQGIGTFTSGPYERPDTRWREPEWAPILAEVHRATGKKILLASSDAAPNLFLRHLCGPENRFSELYRQAALKAAVAKPSQARTLRPVAVSKSLSLAWGFIARWTGFLRSLFSTLLALSGDRGSSPLPKIIKVFRNAFSRVRAALTIIIRIGAGRTNPQSGTAATGAKKQKGK